MAENVLRKVSSGTHTYSKFIKPTELLEFFQNYRGPSDARPWISPFTTTPTRTEAETRGLIYNPLGGSWNLGPRTATWGTLSTDCNYLFWVRKPPVNVVN